MSVDTVNHKIAFASFCAAISVVIIHINFDAPTGGVAWWIRQMTANGLCRWAVPFFFVTAGYFLAKHVNESCWWWIAVKQRSRTIMVPYLLSSTLFALYLVLLCLAANFVAGRPWSANLPVGWDRLQWFGLHPYKGSYNDSLWFLPALFLFVLASPLYVWLVRRIGWFAPVLFLGFSYVGLPKMPFGFNLQWMTYFVGGIAARLRPIHVSKYWGWLLVVGLIAVGFDKYMRLQAGCVDQWDVVPLPFIILMVVGMWAVMPTVVLPHVLRGSIFPIYLLHCYVLMVVSWMLPPIPVGCRVIVFLPLSIAGCILFELLLHRFLPRLASLVFGGR